MNHLKSNTVNPYLTGNIVIDNPTLMGRHGILHEVMQIVRDSEKNALVLYGQRGIGKTSVLQYLTNQIPTQENDKAVYFDLHNKATWSLAQIINALARTIAKALNQTEPDLGEQPEITFFETWLPNLLETLSKNTALVLLIDEFEVLEEPEPEQAGTVFYPYLRQLFDSNLQKLNFVFAGGRQVDDIDLFAVSLFRDRPPIRRLSLLTYEETQNLVRLSQANHLLNWADEAVDSVWRYTQGHPFLTQQIGYHVFAQLNDNRSSKNPMVTAADVEDVIFDVLDASRRLMEWLWESLPPAARVVASVLAEMGPGVKTEQALEKRLYESGMRVVIRELQEAPRWLQDWDWLVANEYRYRVELVRRWITENKPLRRIQTELDRIDPVAHKLYQTAFNTYQEGNLDSAAQNLQEAIELNPNHLAAHQLLADILLAQNQAESARNLLETLYHYQPVVARSRLIQALLKIAQQSQHEEQQLELYEQVLALEPHQPEATAKRREIWQQWGEAALAKEDFKMALEVYKKLGTNKTIAEIEQKISARYFDLITKTHASKRKTRYFVLILVLILVAGGWLVWTKVLTSDFQKPSKTINHKSEQSNKRIEALETALAQANQKNARMEETFKRIEALETALTQANQKNAQMEKTLAQANDKIALLSKTAIQKKTATLEKQLEQANQKIVQLKKEQRQLLRRTNLGQFMFQLEKGDQVVIISSLEQLQKANKKLEKLKAKYPELFYPQMDSPFNPPKENIYQLGDYWAIFISGFYSYNSAAKLKNKVLQLELIDDAFIIKNPFLEVR
jgi:tetratricopeptide (TPR) repeat protein